MPVPPMPPEVADAFAQFSDRTRERLLEVREVIFEVAAEDSRVGVVTEILKWGEPAYLTAASKSGSTIRLGRVRSAPDDCAVLFNCRTTLVDGFRAKFPDVFRFEGQRAIILPHDRPIPQSELRACLSDALAYHLRR